MNNRFNLYHAIAKDNVALSELNQQVFRETFVNTSIVPVNEKDLQLYFNWLVSPESFSNKLADAKQATWLI